MIFLPNGGHHESHATPNLIPSPDTSTEFLFNTNEHFHKSVIAVTHSKQTAVFPLNTAERMKRSTNPVTHSISTAAQISIQYKWKLHDTPTFPKKIANSASRIPRA
jgi:hypothetical protein